MTAARSEQSLRSSWERLALGLLVAVPMLVTAIALLPEVTIPVASVNDDMLHYLFITNASNVLAGGGNVFDHWLSQIDMGLPQFLYYQQLPHLVVIAIQRLTLGSVDLLTVFNVVRYVLLVAFPLTVYWSMRRMGFSPVAAAISAAVASLLSGAQRYGFEYDSYVWRGWGMYTQLWAMHLSFITLATAYRALTTGRGMAIAVIALSALVLSHLIYAYMMVVTIFVIVIVGMNRRNASTRITRLGIIGGLAALISSYMWLPFILSIQYDNATPYLQSYKYDSFGAGEILGWLVSGQLIDVGRLPVFTVLLGIGIVAALVARRRAGVLAVVLFGIWLILYFGRPSVAFLVDLLPLHDSLLLHRFVGSVDLAAIILIGIGGAALWSLFTGPGRMPRLLLAGATGLVFLVPALAERVAWYDLNTAWMHRTEVAMAADTDASAIIATLRTLPPGRVYAGLPATWGSQLHDADVPFYDLLPFYGIEAVPPPSESMSLNSDYVWDFNDHNLAQYDLFNVRYVVAPTSLPVADFLRPIQRAGAYSLYEAPTSGYAEYVNITGWEPVATQRGLFVRNRPWVNGTGPAGRNYVAYDFPTASVVPSGKPARGCPDGGQILSQDVGSGRFAFVVSCSVDSPLVIKATYHPNWHVEVDGQPVRTFMLSPSYIGIQVPAGQHTVTAVYQATPIKTPLLFVGGLALLFTLVLGRRLNPVAEWLGARLRRLGGRLPVPATPTLLSTIWRPARDARGRPAAEAPPAPAADPDLRASSVTGSPATASAAVPSPATDVTKRAAEIPAPQWGSQLEALIRRYPLELLGFGTVILYVVVWLAQRAIFIDASVVSTAPAPRSTAVLEVGVYYAAIGGVFALYGALLYWLHDRELDRRGLRVVLLVPAVVAGLFLLDRAHFSLDVYSYIAHGSIALGGSANANTVLPETVLATPIGQVLYGHGWRPPPIPSPYGPLWTVLERIVTVATGNVDVAAFTFKLVQAAAVAGSAWLVWRIVGLVHPSRRLLATVAFVWNPMVLIELAGEGHNDGLTVLLALLAVWLTVRARPAAGAAATIGGALIKYVPLILLPFQAVTAWRKGGRAAVLGLGAGLVAAGLASALAYGVVGFSPASLDSLLRSVVQGIGWPSFSSSASDLLGALLGSPGATLVKLGLPAAFAVYVLWEAWRSRTVAGVLRALGFVATIYLLGVSPAFLPWYAIFPVALLVLAPDNAFLALAVALSLVSRLMAPLVDLRPEDAPFPWMTLDLIVPISAVLLCWVAWLRTGPEPDSEGGGPANGLGRSAGRGPRPAAGSEGDVPPSAALPVPDRAGVSPTGSTPLEASVPQHR